MAQIAILAQYRTTSVEGLSLLFLSLDFLYYLQEYFNRNQPNKERISYFNCNPKAGITCFCIYNVTPTNKNKPKANLYPYPQFTIPAMLIFFSSLNFTVGKAEIIKRKFLKLKWGPILKYKLFSYPSITIIVG